MSLKTKIIERLKAKFSGVNLSTARVDSIATKIDAKVTQEDQIDAKLDEFNEFYSFADMAKEDDRVRTLESRAKQPDPKTDDPKKEDPKPEPKKEEDMPEWAKAMLGKLTALEGDKVISSRKSVALEKFKDAPESFRNDLVEDLDMITFKDDEHFNSFITRKEKAFGEFKQAESDKGLGNDKPSFGVGGGKLKDDQVSPGMQQVLNERKEAAKQN